MPSSCPPALAILLPLITSALIAAAYGVPLEQRPVVWHDNDDPRDVYTQEFLSALATTGTIRLVGISTTTAITPFNPYVTPSVAEMFGTGRLAIQSAAEASGLSGLPPITTEILLGHFDVLPSGLVEDTQPLNSVVGNAIVAAAHEFGTPAKPLIVVCGGALTAVADAYLIDPSIGEKVLVTWLGGTLTRFSEYNSAVDGWGNAVAVKYLKIIQFPINIPNLDASSPLVPKAYIMKSLPPNQLRDMMLVKDHPGNPLPGSIDADGPGAVWVVNPAIIKTSVKKRLSGTTSIDFGGQNHVIPVLIDDPDGNVTMVTSVDQPLSTRVWWQAFERVYGTLVADPFRYYPLFDTLANAEVALATHEISPVYRGPLVTVLRESDGAVAAFFEGDRQGALDTVRGGGGVELTQWINPDDVVRVMIWHDQSGKGRDAVAPSAATAPRIVENGRLVRGSCNEPVIRFSIQDSLEVDDQRALSDTAQLSVSVWGWIEPWSVATQGIVSKESLTASTGGWGISVNSSNQYQVAMGGTSAAPLARSGNSIAPRKIWHHTSTVFNGALSGNSNKLKSWLDSQPLSLTFNSGNLPNRITAADRPLSIGRGGANLHLDGQLGELIVWTLHLDASKTNQLSSKRFVSEFTAPGEVIPFHDWASLAALTNEAAAAETVVHGDGVGNLLKYAFNLNANGPDRRLLNPFAGDTSGLPAVSVIKRFDGTPEIRLEYLRRKNVGLNYVAEIGRGLDDWVLFDQEPVVTVINSQWERAVIVSRQETQNEPSRFVRVKVRLP